MKCVICQKAKGKRGCKIQSGRSVCPPCCAAIRQEACAGCGHFAVSLAYERQRQARCRPFVCEVLPDVDDRCDEALALLERGETAQAEVALANLRHRHPNYHTVLYADGVLLGKKGKIDEAIACFKRAVEIFPLFAHAQFNLAQSYCQKVDVENAVKAYEAVIAADGTDGPVGSLAQSRLDELDAIFKKTGQSLESHIQNRRIFDQAYAALRDRKFQVAIDLFKQVLAVEKDHVQSYGNMGLAYAALGNKERALECLDKAIALDPAYELAVVNRLVLEKLQDGETVPEISDQEVHYHRDFKLPGKSYVKFVADELRAGGSLPSGNKGKRE